MIKQYAIYIIAILLTISVVTAIYILIRSLKRSLKKSNFTLPSLTEKEKEKVDSRKHKKHIIKEVEDDSVSEIKSSVHNEDNDLLDEVQEIADQDPEQYKEAKHLPELDDEKSTFKELKDEKLEFKELVEHEKDKNVKKNKPKSRLPLDEFDGMLSELEESRGENFEEN